MKTRALIFKNYRKPAYFLLLFGGMMLFYACSKSDETAIVTPKVEVISSDNAVAWGNMTIKVMKLTSGNSPTYGSRAAGYMGLTMYESVVRGSTTNKTLAGQLNGLTTLPKNDTTQKYNWIVSMNAGQAYMLKLMYEQTTDANKASVDSLEKVIYTAIQKSGVAQDVLDRSVKYGQSVAAAIYEWSKTDGGHQGYLRNFDATFQVPVGIGLWVSPAKGQSSSKLPLHPFWGKNRTFSTLNGNLAVPKPIPYSRDTRSQYYAQFLEVYAKNNVLTQEEKEIANWWGDDPASTFPPPGHSYNLATIIIKAAKSDLFKAAETYARVGMAVCDAFINCWKCKYTYMAERPSTFVNYNIDPSWVQYWPEPPFPAFSSGHATQGAATATVLADLYGDNFKFTDNSHVGRAKDTDHNVEYKARSFNSFWEAAEESAYSRFLGGIHTRQDNETGLVEGRKIGQNVNSFQWKK